MRNIEIQTIERLTVALVVHKVLKYDKITKVMKEIKKKFSSRLSVGDVKRSFV